MSEQTLSIEVVGDSESCRENAEWLKSLANGVSDLASAFARAGGQSEGFWQGEASDVFRGSMATSNGNAHHVEQAATAAARELSKFADELDTVKSRMSQAKQVATAAGLEVTDKEIHPPEAGPGATPSAPPADASPHQMQSHDTALSQHNAAVADHQAKVAAFNEVSASVSEARGKERAAHEVLQAAVKKQDELLDSLKTWGKTALTKSVALVGGLAGASQKLLDSSTKNKALATLATALRASPNLPAGADAALKGAQQELLQNAYRDGADRAGVERVIGKLPEGVRGALNFNMSDVAKKSFGMDKGVPAAFQKGIPVLKRLPVIGTGLTAAVAGADIASGKDAVKTTETAVGGTLASVGVSAGIDAGVAAAATAGLAVPGPGWVAAGSLVLGSAAAYGVGYVVDNYGDEINDAVGDAASSVGDAAGAAAKGVKSFAGDIF